MRAPLATGLVGTPCAGAASIDWGRCSESRLRAAGAECGMLVVPLSHADPGGRKIRIAVSRIKASAPVSARQGPLLINPGGPGGEGLRVLASLYRDLPRRVSSTYDLIGFDPRGPGASRPALACESGHATGPRPGYKPVTGRLQDPGPNERRWLARSQGYAAACGKRSGDLLPFLRTEEAARDLDLIRQALGAARINYCYSYGTYRGQVHATLFPTRTKRMVFDGVVDPRNVWYEGQLAPASAGIPVSLNGSETPSLFLVSTTPDGATPFSGAPQVRRLFPRSALVAQVGSTTHSDSLGGNRCVEDVVIRYLRNGRVPARDGGARADVRCSRSALPRP